MKVIGVIPFVASTEVKVSLEVSGKAGRVGDIETVAARVYVFVECVLVARCGEERAALFLKHSAELSDGFRPVGVLEIEFHLSLAVEFQF